MYKNIYCQSHYKHSQVVEVEAMHCIGKLLHFVVHQKTKQKNGKTFYVRDLNYLKTVDIDIDAPNQTKKGIETDKNVYR